MTEQMRFVGPNDEPLHIVQMWTEGDVLMIRLAVTPLPYTEVVRLRAELNPDQDFTVGDMPSL